MALEKAKLFWKPGNQARKIVAVPYDDRMEYYPFVKERHDAGFRQIIVTSETMIQLIQIYEGANAIQKMVIARFRISEIELAENEDEFGEQVGILLNRIETNPARLSELVSLLDFLAEKSSIEIQRVAFMGRTEDGVAVEGFVQSNGVIGANREVSNKIFDIIGAAVERCVFGC